MVIKFFFSEEKPSVKSYFTKRSNLLGQIMARQEQEIRIYRIRQHVENCIFVIHYKAPISLDIFISYLSQIMAIFYFKRFFFLIFKKCSISTFLPYLGLVISEKCTVTPHFLSGF